MKPKITLDNWRFEFLRSTQAFVVGGQVRFDKPEQPTPVTFRDRVVDLQGKNKAPQFEEGFEFETKTRIVTLGRKETFK